jgi:hypothetical protein
MISDRLPCGKSHVQNGSSAKASVITSATAGTSAAVIGRIGDRLAKIEV